jgi:hypothetical protein
METVSYSCATFHQFHLANLDPGTGKGIMAVYSDVESKIKSRIGEEFLVIAEKLPQG